MQQNTITAYFAERCYGLGLLVREAFTSLRLDEPYDLSDLYSSLAEHRQPGGYEVQSRFYEIGSPEGLAETRQYLEARQHPSKA